MHFFATNSTRHFESTLHHWSFGSQETNVADIVNIRILIPPKDPSMAQRRKIALNDPFDTKAEPTD